MNQIFIETRMFRLSDGEEIMTIAFFLLIQYRSVTDRQTDGHSFSGYTSGCIASYANALVKTEPKSFFAIRISYTVWLAAKDSWSRTHVPAFSWVYCQPQPARATVPSWWKADLDLEHTLDAGLPGDHRMRVWWWSGHYSFACERTGNYRKMTIHGHSRSSVLVSVKSH